MGYVNNSGPDKLTPIDKKEYFEEECRELLTNLVKKCYLGGIPCFFTAAVENSENGTEYITDGIMTGSTNIVLLDDKIKHHMMINDGCVAKPAQEEVLVNMDDFLLPADDDMF